MEVEEEEEKEEESEARRRGARKVKLHVDELTVFVILFVVCVFVANCDVKGQGR